jgi:hypothetical protein
MMSEAKYQLLRARERQLLEALRFLKEISVQFKCFATDFRFNKMTKHTLQQYGHLADTIRYADSFLDKDYQYPEIDEPIQLLRGFGVIEVPENHVVTCPVTKIDYTVEEGRPLWTAYKIVFMTPKTLRKIYEDYHINSMSVWGGK